jgi:hypothetical protein
MTVENCHINGIEIQQESVVGGEAIENATDREYSFTSVRSAG